ncbi:hypothetical protein FB45DRAFT_1125480 [Roridomyces roridus]|uniref:F-box domain-containing protein n=1 Tax=Roridomyces roridus TaxID=1738132 RepID=A0AAD7C878_9AGAR|nr:hypothetical protein FB45DRAFT_1125480 [Roridomyces roridus]
MSVQDLESRIEDISADIERQKAVLRLLECDKSLLQRQLNAVRDPVGRLPPEISSEIFVQCLPLDPRFHELHEAPALLLNVCNAWTDIAVSNPKLWSTMNIHIPGPGGLAAAVQKRLQRASSHLLNVAMVGPLDPTVATLIWGHSSQLGRLVLSAGHREMEDDPDEDERLLSLAPNISDLVLWDVELMEEEQGVDGVGETLLPNLPQLLFSSYNTEVGESHKILQHIRAPRLEKLTLESPTGEADIISFLRRSSPPLQELNIGDASKAGLGSLDEVLALVPTLTRLEVEWVEIGRAKQLFNILAQPGVLPNLRILELNHMEKTSEAFWNAVLGVLSACRSKLRTVRIAYHFRVPMKYIPSDVLTGLRALVESDGMDIWLGSGRRPDQNELFT